MPEGRQSPPPETQTGRQQQDPPAEGKGIDNADNKGEHMKSDIENLASNPTPQMDKALKDKFSKGS
ncbi:hypothetical protein NLU13_8810 [Sarocladium strictum]|uniref:Uncharacterized protein n=1 Tax=Sarocladium strictum TaxID=5046 RepID=A0AA39L3T7_SARSR|nr:hypothetical protein NLU13_8810 [Sarocladium strictum]